MKQSRRWAAWLAAMMIAASLVATPREGAALTRYIDPLDPPVIDEGDPDEPSAPATVTRIAPVQVGRLQVFLIPGMPFYVAVQILPVCQSPRLEGSGRSWMRAHRGDRR